MKRIASLLIAFALMFSISLGTVVETRNYVLKLVTNPSSSSTAGEWAVLGVTRYEKNKDFANLYYKNLCSILKDKKGNLSDTKYTEYSRAVIALSSIGKNPKNVAGYNLIEKLEDTEKVKKQGINGAIFALIALDSKNYLVKENVREDYIKYILGNQLADGGFALSGNISDIDITSMAICALYKYKSDEKVNSALSKAVTFLKSKTPTYAESIAQEIVAFCALNDSANSEFLIKLVSSLDSYKSSDGSYKHSKGDDTSSLMSTEQVLYSLVAYDRYKNGKTFLYDMSDVELEYSITIRDLIKQFLNKN